MYKDKLNQANNLINDLKKENEKLKNGNHKIIKTFSFNENNDVLNNKKKIDDSSQLKKNQSRNKSKKSHNKNRNIQNEYTFDLDPNNI